MRIFDTMYKYLVNNNATDSFTARIKYAREYNTRIENFVLGCIADALRQSTQLKDVDLTVEYDNKGELVIHFEGHKIDITAFKHNKRNESRVDGGEPDSDSVAN